MKTMQVSVAQLVAAVGNDLPGGFDWLVSQLSESDDLGEPFKFRGPFAAVHLREDISG